MAAPNPDRRIPDLVAVPAVILRQRAIINTRAHRAGEEGETP